MYVYIEHIISIHTYTELYIFNDHAYIMIYVSDIIYVFIHTHTHTHISLEADLGSHMDHFPWNC